jgi:hypothetical protein
VTQTRPEVTLAEWYRIIQGAVDGAHEGSSFQLFAPWTLDHGLRLVWIDRGGRIWRLDDQDRLSVTGRL